MASPLFGDYQPGAISSFLASVTAGGAGDKQQSKKKPAKLQLKESSSTTTATARLFDEAVRAKFVPQQPLPGLAAPLLKRSRDGEDGGLVSTGLIKKREGFCLFGQLAVQPITIPQSTRTSQASRPRKIPIRARSVRPGR